MRKPCIVKQLLTMQGFSILPGARAAFSEFQARGFAYEN